jgi:surface antigen
MTTIRSIGVFLLGSMLLAGCSTVLGKSGETGAVALSVLPTALLDGPIGKEMTDADRTAAADAEYKALEFGRTGTPVAWKNRTSGHSGEVVPGPNYKVNVFDCRDVTHTVTVTDQPPQSLRATSCRRPEGNWRPVT